MVEIVEAQLERQRKRQWRAELVQVSGCPGALEAMALRSVFTSMICHEFTSSWWFSTAKLSYVWYFQSPRIGWSENLQETLIFGDIFWGVKTMVSRRFSEENRGTRSSHTLAFRYVLQGIQPSAFGQDGFNQRKMEI